jgi:hypothetical protein
VQTAIVIIKEQQHIWKPRELHDTQTETVLYCERGPHKDIFCSTKISIEPIKMMTIYLYS